jgi:hypothetical protein
MDNATRPTAMVWTGRALSALVVLFLAMGATMKRLDLEPVRQASAQLGYPVSLDRTLGVIGLVCLMLYAIPRLAALGAVILTGFLGGAVASHLRLGDPLFSHVLFGVYIGALAWAGLYLRDGRLRALIPVAAT